MKEGQDTREQSENRERTTDPDEAKHRNDEQEHEPYTLAEIVERTGADKGWLLREGARRRVRIRLKASNVQRLVSLIKAECGRAM